MARQNRVTPEAAIIATPARGTCMGNRGILHDAAGRIGAARWRHKAWITCALSFRGRHRVVMTPGHYTELFFLDEAVALAAGHRPCAECRRADFNRYSAAWARVFGAARAPGIDAALHAARTTRSRQQITFEGDVADLPDGVMLRRAGGIYLLHGRALWPYMPEGYGPPRPCPASGCVTVLTPRPSVAVLGAGYRAMLHPTAQPAPI